MPVSCSNSALTGASGLVQFKPAGGTFCLIAGDFPVGNVVTVPAINGYENGDLVKLTEEGAATLDTGLAALDGVYKIVGKPDDTHIEIGDRNSGAPVTLVGDTAGSTGADHIAIEFAEYGSVCSVTEWSLDLQKDQTDVTTLPCAVGGNASAIAPVRKQVGTFLNGEGSMSILFTSDHAALGQRLLANSVMRNSRVEAKLYIDAVSGGATMNDAASMYFEGAVNLLGFSISVNTSDAIVAEVSFSLADQPKALFGVTI